jgi:hypothetical protein
MSWVKIPFSSGASLLSGSVLSAPTSIISYHRVLLPALPKLFSHNTLCEL